MPTKEQREHVEIMSKFLQNKNIDHEYTCPYPQTTQRYVLFCRMCRGFLGMAYRRCCPCGYLGEDKAIDRTWQAIVDFDMGLHKWCK